MEMPWSLWRFTGRNLEPRTPFDLDLVAEKYKEGDILRAKFAKDRSSPQHRLYWGVLRAVVKATEMWATPEDLHVAVRLDLRMVKSIILLDGRIEFQPRSISFSAMDQGDFQKFFDNAIKRISEATGISTHDLIEQGKAECMYHQDAEPKRRQSSPARMMI